MASPRSPSRNERFTARISRSEKVLLQRAADIRGLPLSAYVFEKARVAAAADLAEAGEIALGPADQRRFVDLLINPPVPARALVRALKAAAPRTRQR
jgi:uncharacterized protein (DUF1778 family)